MRCTTGNGRPKSPFQLAFLGFPECWDFKHKSPWRCSNLNNQIPNWIFRDVSFLCIMTIPRLATNDVDWIFTPSNFTNWALVLSLLLEIWIICDADCIHYWSARLVFDDAGVWILTLLIKSLPYSSSLFWGLVELTILFSYCGRRVNKDTNILPNTNPHSKLHTTTIMILLKILPPSILTIQKRKNKLGIKNSSPRITISASTDKLGP